MNFNSPLVALEGFEPSQAEPESDVLPLHHKARFIGVLRVQSYGIFFICASFFDFFLLAQIKQASA